MLNPELLRRDPERTRATLARRGDDAVEAFNTAIAVDTEWRRITADVETLRTDRKKRSSDRRGRPSDAEVQEERRLGEQLAELERALKDVDERRKDAISWVPNL